MVFKETLVRRGIRKYLTTTQLLGCILVHCILPFPREWIGALPLGNMMSEIRIGHGYDVHAFTAGDHLMIGGVRIEYNRAFLAHSDGDVLIHALCDALLGAASLGDIGRHFPDTDPRYAGADSRELLRLVRNLLTSAAWHINNIDCTIIAQVPKLVPYIDGMLTNLATDLRVPAKYINIKATTTERLGFTGREEGIAAHTVCLIVRAT